MRISKINIQHFKRFTDLTISEVPSTARLIVLAGPNGSGKSSFFDALHIWHQQHSRRGPNWQDDYHRKSSPAISPQYSGNEVSLEFHHPVPSSLEAQKKMFYIRSAYRNEADFRVDQIGRMNHPLDLFPVDRMIDSDQSVSKNFQRLVSEGIVDLYGRANAATTFGAYRDLAVNRIRNHLLHILPDLALNTLSNPFDDGTFRFTKGTSRNFSYKNLSGGEKAAFDLITDLVMAIRDYDDTIYCIDEPESHLSTRIQATLLTVLFGLIPENCQLMLATHSIGMMRCARDLAVANPSEVVFLDFGDNDFDQPVIIEPSSPNRTFWRKQYEVALDDLATLVTPKQVVICEGELNQQSGALAAFDAQCYEHIFESEFVNTRFISMGNDRQIIGDQRGLAEALLTLVDGIEVIRLIDRDNRTDSEIADLREEGVRVLSRRTIESYLLDDEVLTALCSGEGKPDLVGDTLEAKRNILGQDFNSKSGPIKAEVGKIFESCKAILGIEHAGSNRHAFMRDILAPLMTSDMEVYQELKTDIFG